MKRLVLVAFLLLLAGEWLGWQRHLPINGAKTSIVILLTLGYSVLLWFIYRRGMPGAPWPTAVWPSLLHP